jgi:hypothetical protein
MERMHWDRFQMAHADPEHVEVIKRRLLAEQERQGADGGDEDDGVDPDRVRVNGEFGDDV